MYESLRQYVTQFVAFKEKELSYFEQLLVFREVPRKFILIDEGQVARELFFVNQGCVRLYYNNNGEDVTGFIFLENLFATSFDSFLQQSPSTQILETLEPCELLVMDSSGMQKLYDYSVNFQIMGRRIAEQRFINAQQILSSYILDSPEERYKKLLTTQPDWIQCVPQHYIASFLGITPVSLSRIRKRIM